MGGDALDNLQRVSTRRKSYSGISNYFKMVVQAAMRFGWLVVVGLLCTADAKLPLPTAAQLAYHAQETTQFMHFG